MEAPEKPTQTEYLSNPLDLLKPTWEAFKLAWLPLLKIFLAGVAVVFLFGMVAYVVIMLIPNALLPFQFLLGITAIIAFVIIANYLSWMTTKVLIEAARGHRLSFTEARPARWQAAVSYFWTGLLMLLIVLLGFLLLIVPGVIFLIWFFQSSMIVVDEGLSGWPALKRSKELVRGRFWEVMSTVLLPGCGYVLGIIPVIGPFLYFVASLVLMPVTYIRYHQLKQLKQQPDWEKVPVDSMNYVVIVAALILLAIGSSQESKNASLLEKSGRSY
jgi:hypothetical protein